MLSILHVLCPQKLRLLGINLHEENYQLRIRSSTEVSKRSNSDGRCAQTQVNTVWGMWWEAGVLAAGNDYASVE